MNAARWLRTAIFPSYLIAGIMLTGGIIAPPAALARYSDIPQLQAAAEKGYVPQQIELAAAYFTGQGVRQDAKLAAYWYEKAAKSGDPEAENEIAFLYQTGQGVPIDPTRAFHWFQLSATSGYVKAKVNLGVLYVWGIGVEKNEVRAAELFHEAVDHGSGAAAGYLGDMCYFGKGMKQDKAAAESWYAAGARLHDPVSAFNLGSLLSVEPDHPHDFARAAALLRDAATEGYIPAMHSLGLLLTNRPDLAISSSEPRSMLAAASGAGSWQSTVVLGIRDRDGKDGPPDPEAAFRLFRIALLQGGDAAKTLLANDLKVLAEKLPADRTSALSTDADLWFAQHPWKLDTVYRKGGFSRRFPVYARTVPDREVHAGQLVFPPPA
jgi:uncharacterized protein